MCNITHRGQQHVIYDCKREPAPDLDIENVHEL